jgi:hypothetical protein
VHTTSDERPARSGQDDAGAATARHPSRPRRRGCRAGRVAAVAGRRTRRHTVSDASLRGTPSQRERDGVDRRRKSRRAPGRHRPRERGVLFLDEAGEFARTRWTRCASHWSPA